MAANQITPRTPRKVIVVGHAIKNDLGSVETLLGARFKHVIPNYGGVLDTQVIAGQPAGHPQALSDLAATRYGLYPLVAMKYRRGREWVQGFKPKRRKRGRVDWHGHTIPEDDRYFDDDDEEPDLVWIFQGQHNAMNDAVATLKVLLAQALDININSAVGNPLSLGYDNLLALLDASDDDPPILVAIDTEKIDHRDEKRGEKDTVFQVGVAWLDVQDLRNKRAGNNGINWHSNIQSLLFIIRPRERYRLNSPWCASPPPWTEPGPAKTRIVDKKDLCREIYNILAGSGAVPPLGTFMCTLPTCGGDCLHVHLGEGTSNPADYWVSNHEQTDQAHSVVNTFG